MALAENGLYDTCYVRILHWRLSDRVVCIYDDGFNTQSIAIIKPPINTAPQKPLNALRHQITKLPLSLYKEPDLEAEAMACAPPQQRPSIQTMRPNADSICRLRRVGNGWWNAD